MKPWEQVNRLETQTEKKNGKRGKLHLLHGSQVLPPVWTGMIKRRKGWEYSSCIIIHVTVFWGHFESHSLLKCSRTRWAGFVSKTNVVHRSFIKKSRLLFSPRVTTHEVSSVKFCPEAQQVTKEPFLLQPGDDGERGCLQPLLSRNKTGSAGLLTNMGKRVVKATGTTS